MKIAGHTMGTPSRTPEGMFARAGIRSIDLVMEDGAGAPSRRRSSRPHIYPTLLAPQTDTSPLPEIPLPTGRSPSVPQGSIAFAPGFPRGLGNTRLLSPLPAAGDSAGAPAYSEPTHLYSKERTH